ncbi:MAG: nucleoside phosphorylase [Bacteroidales bacterium]|nr:nucleoside phosphorylase [Candidatus Physcousia equi]
MRYAESELIINEDGSVFHLHLRPEQLADRVILVGDPGRVEMVATHFERRECELQSREFHTVTGSYTTNSGETKRVTCLSTGIGCDNIDIVMNELDALANIDLKKREDRDVHKRLTIVRIGTCGGLQPDTPIGTFVASVKSIGFDGLLNYYADRNRVCDTQLEHAFAAHMQWNPIKGAPYVSTADADLVERIAGDDMVRGITCACGGFYGPQGRQLRVAIEDTEQNEKIEAFRYGGLKICNFEMESSALAGLSALLGHRAMTCCMVIANRYAQEMKTDYKRQMDDLVKMVLERI